MNGLNYFMETPTAILPLEMFGVVRRRVELHRLCGVGYELIDFADARTSIDPGPAAGEGVFVLTRENPLLACGNSFFAGVTTCRITDKVAAEPGVYDAKILRSDAVAFEDFCGNCDTTATDSINTISLLYIILYIHVEDGSNTVKWRDVRLTLVRGALDRLSGVQRQ